MKSRHAALPAVAVVLWFICGAIARAYAASASKPVRVYVECTNTNDSTGVRFCLTLKEKIRASQGFELVDSEKPLVFEVHIITESDTSSPEQQAFSSAASVVFTLRRTDATEMYLTSFVLDFGSERTNEEAENILAHIDQESTFLRKLR